MNNQEICLIINQFERCLELDEKVRSNSLEELLDEIDDLCVELLNYMREDENNTLQNVSKLNLKIYYFFCISL